MKPHQPELVYGFFCEFIRVEMSGQVTPVGIWGESCKLGTEAPARLPALAFHAYVRNPDHQPYKFKLRLTFPGNPTPLEVEADIPGDKNQASQHLNFNFMNVQLKQPGDVVALLHLETKPPIEKEFRLNVQFQPQGKS